ncbi:DUF4296 domain-containing protein [Mariniflexile gromovii]|uniref:DUF4296 domain-containing protein n=1 Tax=Mariniflexile gromovii TaxID=362523 RepID=A0ABS4BW51_9FLAO|nr:DUF4296 domain-containing protein [Mariniflexile gromovii]MBP0904817.1 DUF4296 domain-containing protein [Mariniflexile gromovii]
MMKRLLISLTVIFLVAACGFGGPEKPKNLISKETMVNILIDARLMGSATFIDKQKMLEHGIKPENYVFEKYGIDSLQFASSNAYYAYHIKEYEEIYNTVTDSLERLKKTLNELKLKEEKEEKKRVQDSIDALKVKDSLDINKIKDSLTTGTLKKQIKKDEGALINPVSYK